MQFLCPYAKICMIPEMPGKLIENFPISYKFIAASMVSPKTFEKWNKLCYVDVKKEEKMGL